MDDIAASSIDRSPSSKQTLGNSVDRSARPMQLAVGFRLWKMVRRTRGREDAVGQGSDGGIARRWRGRA